MREGGREWGRGRGRKEEETRAEFIYGRQPVLEILKAGQRSIHKIWLLQGTGGDIVNEIQQLGRAKGIPVEWAVRDHLDKRVQGHHQGVVAQVSAATFQDLQTFLENLKEGVPVVVVAMDEIQDPYNVGAILRSAGFFGVSAALLPKWRSAPVSESAARVSSGAVDHVTLIRITNLAETIRELQEAGFEVLGAEMDGEPLETHPISLRTAIVFGGEGAGLRRLVRERCDKLLRISGAGPVASLNVGASAAIFLHHFCRTASQNDKHQGGL